MRHARLLIALATVAAGSIGCGGDDVEPRGAGATGPANLQARVEVRAERNDLWRPSADVAPGGDVDVRLRVANKGAEQAQGLRGGIVLPAGLRYVRGSAAEYRIPPSTGTGAPIDGRRFIGGAFPIRALPGEDVTTYQIAARVPSASRGSLTVRGRVTGEGGPASDTATIRVRRTR